MSLNKAQAMNAAKQYVLQRNLQAAVEIYRRIIEADPSDLNAINALGDLFASAGRPQDAIIQFSRVADSYIESGAWPQAIATLKKILSLDPASAETAIKLADTYAQAGHVREARQYYLQIAETLTRRGRTVEALPVYRKVIGLDPSNAATRIKLGELCLREGLNDQAYEAFVDAADQLAAKSEHKRALSAYNEALSIRPDSIEASEGVRKMLASFQAAERDKDSRSSAPQNPEPRDRAHEKSPAPVAAEPPKAAAPVDQNTQGSDIILVQELSKAEILVAYGQVNQAVAMLRDVLRTRPDSIDVHEKLKDIYLRTGMMTEAARECLELERIYEARGESERARDYAVRAGRLSQFLGQPSGDLPASKRNPVQEVEARVDAQPPSVDPVEAARKPAEKFEPRVEAAQKPPEQVEPRVEAAPPSGEPAEPKPKSPQAPAARFETKPLSSSPADAARKPVGVVQPRIYDPSPSLSETAHKTLTVERPVDAGTSADLPESSHKPIEVEPSVAVTPAQVSLNRDLAQKPRPVASKLEEPADRLSRITVAVPEDTPSPEAATQSASGAAPLSQVRAVEALTVSSGSELDVRADESALALTTHPWSSTSMITSPASLSRSLLIPAMGRRVAAAAVVFLLLGVSAVIGGFVYDANLDKQYQTLAIAAPGLAPPPPPPIISSDEPAARDQADEQVMLVVTPSGRADSSDQRQSPEPLALRNQAPSPRPPAIEPPKPTPKAAPTLPRTAVGGDNRVGTEDRTPLGVPGNVPVTAHPAEPPPKAIRQSAGVVPGGAVKKVEPVYPAAARDARQGGSVTVEVTINEQGNVTSARALSGPQLLRSAAVSAARAWKFRATTLGGAPVTTTTTIIFNFKL